MFHSFSKLNEYAAAIATALGAGLGFSGWLAKVSVPDAFGTIGVVCGGIIAAGGVLALLWKLSKQAHRLVNAMEFINEQLMVNKPDTIRGRIEKSCIESEEAKTLSKSTDDRSIQHFELLNRVLNHIKLNAMNAEFLREMTKDVSKKETEILKAVVGESAGFVQRTTKILIVEDYIPSCLLLAKILQSPKNEIQMAKTLAEAFAKLEGIDWLLIDLMLPDGTGETLISFIETNQLPIKMIAMSAIDGNEKAEFLLRHPSIEFMQKPLGPKDIARLSELSCADLKADAKGCP